MEYLRKMDPAVLNAGGDAPGVQWLLPADSGSKNCTVVCVKTPPGSGSAHSLHTHPFDQIYYVLNGVMNIEIDGKEHRAEPGTLVFLPAGMPHRNWNGGPEHTVHLSFNTPLPKPGEAQATPVARG